MHETTSSADGTAVAYEAYGSGPVVAVVGGAFCDRGAFRDLARSLGEAGFTGVTYDRRGRGDSGDTAPYAVVREVEDLAAVISATSATGRGFAHGISSGGGLVIEALATGIGVDRASMLEPPYRVEGAPPVPVDYVATLERLEAAGDRAGIVRYFHTAAVGLPEEMLEQMVGTPMWESLLAMAPTVRYDALCLGDSSLPVDRLASIDAPVLTIASTGTQKPFLRQAPAAVAAALPHGRHVELEGGFHEVPADVLTPVLAEFFLG